MNNRFEKEIIRMKEMADRIGFTIILPKEKEMENPCCSHSKVVLKTVGIGGGAMRNTWQCETCGTPFKPEEREMEKQKFQFESEEQARWFLWNCVYLKASDKDFTDIVDIECSIREMRQNGVIRKSELETLVEEAGEMYRRWQKLAHDDTLDINFQLIVKLQNAFQALIKENERLKK